MNHTTTQQKGQPEAVDEKMVAPLYVNFMCYKLNPEFRRLNSKVRERGAKDFLTEAKRHLSGSKLQLRSYLATGFRAEVDLVLWAISEEMGSFQTLATDLASTGLGSYLEPTHTFLALRKGSPYTKHHPQAFEQKNLPPYKYLFLYPFVKTRQWYLLPFEKRREMMREHTTIGSKYPSVRINTTYSFGLGDQDFVLAFESNEAADFEGLVQDLRGTQASLYTVRDTPFIVATQKKSLEEAVWDLKI